MVEVRERRTSRTGSIHASAPSRSGGSVESFSTECGDASRGSFGSFPGDERHESRSCWLGDSVMAVPARPGAPSMAPSTPVRDALGARTRSSLDARDVFAGLAPGRSARRGRRDVLTGTGERLIFQPTERSKTSTDRIHPPRRRRTRLALPPRSPSHHLPPGIDTPSSFHAAYSFPAMSPVTE